MNFIKIITSRKEIRAMIERIKQASFLPFSTTQSNSKEKQLDSYEAIANRDDQMASWKVDGHDNLQKIATEVSAVDGEIEKLKTQYAFYEEHEEDILAVLRSYPFLITELNKVYELKCQYLGEAPLTLYYQNETFSLEDATLAAAVELDEDLWEEKLKEDFFKFEKACWRGMLREAKSSIAVIFE
jgi:hypothetical protein